MQAAAATIKSYPWRFSRLVQAASSVPSRRTPRRSTEWQHYPPGEVYDPQTHAQYFYHAHPPAQRAPARARAFPYLSARRGNARRRGPADPARDRGRRMPRASPQAPPLKHGRRDEVSHLVAIALDAAGSRSGCSRPIAGSPARPGIAPTTSSKCWTASSFLLWAGRLLLNDWIAAIITLFRPQIAWLLRQRDETVIGWRQRRRTNVFEDIRLEVTSSFDIDLDAQFGFLDQLQTGVDGAGSASRSAAVAADDRRLGRGPRRLTSGVALAINAEAPSGSRGGRLLALRQSLSLASRLALASGEKSGKAVCACFRANIHGLPFLERHRALTRRLRRTGHKDQHRRLYA